ncbi:hypothetical protein AAC387_Pa05g0945 [Persea americana]
MPIKHLPSEHPESQWCHLSASQFKNILSQPHDQWPMPFYGHPCPAWADTGYNPAMRYELGATQFKGGRDNNEDDSRSQLVGDGEREPLFEKPLTPSDVGKLNRLVIPKQHAERYFPLESEKGLQLSFEDEAGKVWRFRYSYWNSSQSYVLTKGWSRFVKEKRLDAGDIVSFERLRPNGERLYIGWRRRAATLAAQDGCTAPASVAPWGPLSYARPSPYPVLPPHVTCIGGEEVDGNSPAPAASKRLRLFGVNLDCPADGSVQPNDSCWSGLTDEIFYQGIQFNGSSSQA